MMRSIGSADATHGSLTPDDGQAETRPAGTHISIRNVTVRYGDSVALQNVSLDIPRGEIFGLFGPARSGKTTLLRAINRMNDLIHGSSLEGEIYLSGADVYAPTVDVARLRQRVGVVYALPSPLPMTIFENAVYGPRLVGVRDRSKLLDICERALTDAAIWDEVKDRLDMSALRLSGGQQQRLCLARALALEPEVLMLDEPTSGLDPISTAKIEDSLRRLKSRVTVIFAPSSVQQAARVSDTAAFLLMGELVEVGPGGTLFTNPKDHRTDDYVTGRFG